MLDGRQIIFRDILLDHWRNNPVFYDEMCDVLDVYSFGVENGEELDVPTFQRRNLTIDTGKQTTP
jgi:hypothetical protein